MDVELEELKKEFMTKYAAFLEKKKLSSELAFAASLSFLYSFSLIEWVLKQKEI